MLHILTPCDQAMIVRVIVVAVVIVQGIFESTHKEGWMVFSSNPPAKVNIPG